MNCIDIPGQTVNTLFYDPEFFEKKADDLLKDLMEIDYWFQDSVVYNAKTVTLPRRYITFYDGEGMATDSSGRKEIVTPWRMAPALLIEARKKLEQKYGPPFPNVVRLQRYEDGDKYIGPHRDQRSEGSWDYPIATVSLGQEREFVAYNCTCKKEGNCSCCKPENEMFRQHLGSGSLLEMPAGFQADHKHSIAKCSQECATRISLTFRYLQLAGTSAALATSQLAHYKLHGDAYKPPQKTIGGYNGYQVTSALQKCIRRGLERDALFWATELWASCTQEGREYIWHRLRVIASEDVGLADNDVCVQVSALYANFMRRPNEKLFLTHAVLILARASKSRIVDHAGIVIAEGPRPKREIPPFAIDSHAGGQMNWEESFRLEGCALVDGYEREARSIREGKK